MRLLFYSDGNDTAAWVAALRHVLPEARVEVWPAAAANGADYALV